MIQEEENKLDLGKSSDTEKENVHVDFLAKPELTRSPPGPMEEIDHAFLIEHAASRGRNDYKYSEERHKRVKDLCQKTNQSQDLLNYLDRNYNFIYWMTRKVRLHAINSISGMLRCCPNELRRDY